VSGRLLEPGIMTRHPRSARWPLRDWGLIVCEAVTVTALLATLVSLAGAGNVPRGPDPLPAGTVPRGAFAACARFMEGAGPSPSAGRANIEAWQWARLTDGRFRVRGYADSRSPLREPHRTYYQCDLVQLQPGRWSLDSVAFSAQEPGPLRASN
jgi:hypothetical protein